MKVIFHILELNKWQTNIQNIRDLLSNDAEAEIEVIVGSDAACLFGKYSGIDFDDLLNNPKVRITISKFGLENNNLDSTFLPAGVHVDDYIITRVAKLQHEGYAYIRL
ncbi:hypothetical protein SAMN00017477_0408 [Peptoniphilus asaccharolyticus DSM 20463]|uniref:DsrE/DsrF-like family protein n=1 Tax=Peptoniphilus asaccharolyticus DSM 20463 TaxID=573058 RepID=A0A1W1ULW4_PEPAS|nr:hypothetical protein [Peptoniphilus asaccharolyticus]MBL7574885.1 hypothetical protein [Peptoniphilus asaccharolyticus]SMB82096.1 hypothetical protein SAMN00017477_0408 [Peptoniphilus asaccharolyticus DSM 20463]